MGVRPARGRAGGAASRRLLAGKFLCQQPTRRSWGGAGMKGLGQFLCSSLQQPHVSRLFLDLNSNQFPAVGLFESDVTFDQWASRPGPFPRLDNVRKTWWAWTEIASATFRGVAGRGVCPGLATNLYREDSNSVNGTHSTSIAVHRDISENS